MRLTLRTMLAHLDGILDPADSEDLARKIAENEFAATLAHRIGDCTKRLRLGAPKVLGKGTALDPNTVAEYLDSTLAPERMPDFEKVCLESDVHLAEVAACHHILTMVVGQPAQVDHESRQRMYAIAAAPAEVAMSAPATNGATNGAVTNGTAAAHQAAAVPAISEDPSVSVDGFPAQAAAPQPRKVEVPDYLREGARQQKATSLFIMVMAVAITATALVFKDQLLGLVGLGEKTEVVQSDGKPGDGTQSPQPAATPAEVPPIVPENDAKPAAEIPVATQDPATRDVATPSAPHPTDAIPKDDNTPPLPGDAARDQPPVEPAPPTDNTPPTDNAARPNVPAAPPANTGGTNDTPQQPPAAPRVEKAEPVGKLVSGDQLLLRFDPQAGEGGDWLRVPDAGMVFGGDRIVALPTFRPRLVLSNGLLVELIGDSRDGTIVELLAPDANGTPGICIVHGRLAKISAPGKQNVVLRTAFGKQLATVTLADTTTSLAIDMFRPYLPGEDPMSVADPATAVFYATSGSVDVAIEGARPVTVNESMRLVCSPAGVGQPEPATPLPIWLDKPEVEWLDGSAATRLMRELTPTASVGVVLAEALHGRQVEGQSLAARSFSYLGRYDPLVTAGLKDEKLAWNWREKVIEGMRQAIRRGSDSATFVRAALVKEFGDRNGGVMYRMLCGYSPAELQNGSDVKLVENLEHVELPFRALAVFNLSSITGANLGYQPDARENLRRTWVVRWRERLQRREIVYRNANDKPARGPAAKGPAIPPAAAQPAAPKPAATTPPPESTEPARDVAPLADPPASSAQLDAPPAETPPPPAAGPDGR